MKRLLLFFSVLLCFLLYGNLSFAETLTKLENQYTNEQVMEYLLDNITIYTSKTINGTTWATCRNNWETETDNVVFYYYYNNNASSDRATSAAFLDGNITYNTTTQSAPTTNNLSLTGYELYNMGNSIGTAHYSYLSNYSAKWGNNVNSNYLKYYIYKDDNGDWWQYTNNANISLENIQTRVRL